MLVLSRKKNQTVIIDGQIEIEILKVKGNTVSLGISAPRHIKVLRGEIAPIKIDVAMSESVNDGVIEFDTRDLDQLPNPFVAAQAS